MSPDLVQSSISPSFSRADCRIQGSTALEGPKLDTMFRHSSRSIIVETPQQSHSQTTAKTVGEIAIEFVLFVAEQSPQTFASERLIIERRRDTEKTEFAFEHEKELKPLTRRIR